MFVFLPKPIAGLFFHDKESLSIAVNYLIIIGFSEAFMAIELMTIGALSGLGMNQLAAIISIRTYRGKDSAGYDPQFRRNGT